MLGIFAGLTIALGLWLVAEPWAYPSSCGANQACNFNDYLRQVWYRYAPFTQFVLPILMMTMSSLTRLSAGMPSHAIGILPYLRQRFVL